MLHWLKGLGFFGVALLVMVMGFSLTLIMPLISILTVIVGIVVLAGWLGQQYAQYCKEKSKP
jgi:hypothetical protein